MGAKTVLCIPHGGDMDRRYFMKTALAGVTLLSSSSGHLVSGLSRDKKSKIALIKSQDRKAAIQQILQMVDLPSPQEKKVFIKPNFNTADSYPGSTDNRTLAALVKEFKERGARSVSVGDRSGPQPTSEVLKDKGIYTLSDQLGFDVVDFSKISKDEWIHFNPDGNHWSQGFDLAAPAVNAEYLVTTPCLKTHRFGGVFTLSLKLTVGMAPRGLMRELHSSPHMRLMIAELNQPFQPQVMVMDGVEAFVDGGPMNGTRKKADVFLAGTDRIAMDAVGVAVLKELGSNDAIMETKIFEQEQIKRAVELGMGVSHPEQIELITDDKPSAAYAGKLKEILLKA
ncbi:MAG: DUF362 domain-containing protein [Candidatus Aminicenantes bacterium]|nr:DUF362 domain-containing protein [Candidatus Aminicenantes bacterium]